MFKKQWLWIPAILAAGLTGYLTVRHLQPPAPNEPPDEYHGPPVTIDNLSQLLASDDQKAKTAAEKFLAAVPYQNRGDLEEMRIHAADPAIKAALRARLLEINRLLATNPPPISLHVHNARLATVVEALNVEMGTQIRCFKDSPPAFSLDVADKPFWEVILALQKQHSFVINASDVMMFDDLPNDGSQYAISGPFLFHAVDRPFTPVLPGGRPNVPSLTFVYQLQSDPRMSVTQVSYEVHLAGPALNPSEGGGLVPLPPMQSGKIPTNAVSVNLTHRWLATAGNVNTDLVTSITASAVFIVQIPDLSLEVGGIDSKPGWEQSLGDVVVAVPEFHSAPGATTFTFKVTPPEMAELLTLRITDPDGGIHWRNTGNAFGSSGELAGKFTGITARPPYNLQVLLADSVHEVHVNFQTLNVHQPEKP